MPLPFTERISGVGAFIVVAGFSETSFLTIEEQATKRSSNKIKGMRSLPMETIEPGESHVDALYRLFKEEVGFSQIPQIRTLNPLAICQLTPGVVLHGYLVEVPETVAHLAKIGSHSHEVGNIEWTSVDEVFKARGSYRFRPGVLEVVRGYQDFLKYSDQFQPKIHAFPEDSVPSEVFDILESRANQTQALSQSRFFPAMS